MTIAGSQFQSLQLSVTDVLRAGAPRCAKPPAEGTAVPGPAPPAPDLPTSWGWIVIRRVTRTRGENGLWSPATNSTLTTCGPGGTGIAVDGLHAMLVTRPSTAMWMCPVAGDNCVMGVQPAPEGSSSWRLTGTFSEATTWPSTGVTTSRRMRVVGDGPARRSEIDPMRSGPPRNASRPIVSSA